MCRRVAIPFAARLTLTKELGADPESVMDLAVGLTMEPALESVLESALESAVELAMESALESALESARSSWNTRCPLKLAGISRCRWIP